MATSPTNPQAQSTSVVARIIIGLLVLLGLGVVVWLSVLSFGQVHGEEFNPGTFKRRTFAYYQIPVINMQVTPIWRTAQSSTLQTDIAKLKSFKNNSAHPWHVVTLWHARRLLSEGDASILCSYLDDEDGWTKWTTDHPDLANVLWPEVAQLARDRMYIFIPHALELALSAQDPDELRAAIQADVADRYVRIAKRDAELGKHDRVVVMLDAAADYAPTDEEITKVRIESFDQLTDEQKEGVAEHARLRAEAAIADPVTEKTSEDADKAEDKKEKPAGKKPPAEKPLEDDSTA